MAISFGDLWKPSGTVDRGSYAVVGVVAFAIKRYLDLVVATYAFRHNWTLFSYWFPMNRVDRITQLRGEQAEFLGGMVALSLPFYRLSGSA